MHEKHALATNNKGVKPTSTTTTEAWGGSLFQKAPPCPLKIYKHGEINVAHACVISTDGYQVEIDDGNQRREPPTHNTQTSAHEKHTLATDNEGEKPTSTTTTTA